MKRNKILSSAFVMIMASFGAFGADKIITSANTCTVDVLGVSDNNATANTIATWDLIDYTLNPGQYLNVTETSVDKTTCPAGSYCVGGGFTVETAGNSIAQCPTGYPNSANGASSDTQCYTACTVDMVAKATKVTGNDYYGTGTDTCEPTECVAGWHVKPGLNLTDTIGTTDTGTGWTSNDNTGTKKANVSITPSDAGIAGEPMAFAVVYGDKGMITGRGRCSTQAGDNNDNTWTDPTIADNWPDETGEDGAQYCYCQLDGYKSADGESTPIVAAPWVFLGDSSTGDGCASTCPQIACVTLLHTVVDSVLQYLGLLMDLPHVRRTQSILTGTQIIMVHISKICVLMKAVLPFHPTQLSQVTHLRVGSYWKTPQRNKKQFHLPD